MKVATPPITTAPSPTTADTPRMIVHSGLVSLPTAGKAPVGRRRTSAKANASMTNAATASASKNQRRGVIAPANTHSDYLVRAADVPKRQPRTGAGGTRRADPPGTARRSGLGGTAAALLALAAVERALVLAGAAPVERLLPALGQPVVLAGRPRTGVGDVPTRAAGQRAHRVLVAPLGEPGGQFPQRFRDNHAGACRRVHGLAGRYLAHLGPEVDGATHYGFHLPWPASRAGPRALCAGACVPELFSSVPLSPSGPVLPMPVLAVLPVPAPAGRGSGSGLASPASTAASGGACAFSAVSRRNDS